MQAVALGSSFERSCLRMCAKARHPKMRMWETAGRLPCQASYGVRSSRDVVGLRLRQYTAASIASAQNCKGRLAAMSIVRPNSTTVRFIRSTTPFWFGV